MAVSGQSPVTIATQRKHPTESSFKCLVKHLVSGFLSCLFFVNCPSESAVFLDSIFCNARVGVRFHLFKESQPPVYYCRTRTAPARWLDSHYKLFQHLFGFGSFI